MTFNEYFQALWDKEPFPWQTRLAETVQEGRWPACIGLPTAAGKTAVIDIAVFALANNAPSAARRTFFVVDRRIIVDEAAERATKIADRLRGAGKGSPLRAVADSLRALSGCENPLATNLLRGGIPRDNSWVDSPIQPAVICSTVDQIGSSILFRAYGGSAYARPIRAALATSDSLIILDEAHTSQPFAQTLRRVSQYAKWAQAPLLHSLRVVELSATPRIPDAFMETEADIEHPVLTRRWRAQKRARLVTIEASKEDAGDDAVNEEIAAKLASEATAIRDRAQARVIGVIANRVLTARRAYERLALDADSEAILLTGRARAFDRDRIWQEWKSQIGLDRPSDPARPIFVVATQCIEVGANLDFDALVTETASIDALEQRFGRLDRDGKKELTHAAIVGHKHRIGPKKDDPLYASALPATWKWLLQNKTVETVIETLPAEGKKKPKTKKTKIEFFDMGVLALRNALKNTPSRTELLMPRRDAAILMPAHVDLLCQTSPEPAVSPEPSVYLHGPETSPPDVQVIWRADLEGQDPKSWIDTLAICPPSAAEAIQIPIWALRAWLAQESPLDMSDVEGGADRPNRNRSEERFRPALAWRGPNESDPAVGPESIKPGATLVVPAAYGGCDQWGWNPRSTAVVEDIADQVKLRMERPTLRLHPSLTSRWPVPEFAKELGSVESESQARTLLRAADPEVHGWVGKAAKLLSASRWLRLIEPPDSAKAADQWAAIVGRGSFDQSSPQSSFTNEVLLTEHLAGCESFAKTFSASLPPILANTAAAAAALHDIGKADRRFQAWLRGGNPIKPRELLAKSAKSARDPAAIKRAREMSGYPEGGRHELTSAALLVNARSEFEHLDFELLLHLIASHHGRCRPFAPVINDAASIEITYEHRHAGSAHGLERAGSGVSERFWKLTRRYGWWGLAYLEALVRLADQRQSEVEEERATPTKGAASA